jgi:hypothetical protein
VQQRRLTGIIKPKEDFRILDINPGRLWLLCYGYGGGNRG